ncbi:hypothetical protein PsYK624_082310 [Phanerochaete sordida]|uniref:Protein kinase domain-containing protein n=1 Tax=Phanerochaete sordida TaxID=48140 RepID=A0A9P3GC01_9APHY|nr:hypothetical protein PsYK624_082310 [Phanerochaete sordida]
MDDAGRGFDLSAVLATRREVTLLTDAVHDLLYTFQHPADEHDAPRVLPCAELSLDCSDTYPVYKIRVTDDTTGDSTELVVRRPFAGDSSLFGRGTRAYLAYDLKARKLVVLKDTWRAKDRRQRAESAILRELHANDVPFIPQVLYGGDVPGSNDAPQHTVVDELSAEQAQRRCTDTPLLGHIHHRMVQDIFYPLQTVRNERELIQALHDTIITLDIAHQKLGILHRDLSYQNIMLDSQGRCVVNDWDSAGPFTPDGGAVGTVHFMSIRLLRNESLPNEPVDDLQSLFWVLSFAALLCFAQYHGGIRSGLFDDRNAREGGDPSSVSTAKVFSLRDGSLYRGRYCCAALTALVAELADAWAEYQRVLFAPKGACIPALELKPEMLELAARPSYWLEKFAAALAKYDADEREARIADQLEDLAASREDLAEAAAAGGKRKAGDSDVPVAGAQGEGPQLARRSKRLRAIRQRQ